MKPETDKDGISPAKSVRKPIQSRSINTKEKILSAALEMFCEKGYYATTTNEIAKRAQVSIGSLYSYFKDKDTIFFEILERYHEKFTLAKDELLKDPDFLISGPRAWLKTLIENLIKVHEDTKELNRELIVLSYYNPKVAEILRRNRERTLQSTIGYFINHQGDLQRDDAEASAVVVFDLISATVDRVAFEDGSIERERLIDKTVDIVAVYFGF